MTQAPALAAEHITRSFPKSGFTLDVERVEAPAGSVLVLLGPSGSGKTTLLHILGLLEHPDSGRILLGGREVTAGDRDARLQMAAVFQRPYLFKGNVAGNVAYGLDVRGVSAAEKTARVAKALERVGLAGYQQRSALALSGGEAQRVSLARALVLEPRVLLLDEPLASLDPLLKRRLAHDFARILRESGATAIWVTHDQDEALLVADHIAVMNAGRIVTSGPADGVMTLPADDWTASFLGLEQPQTGTVRSSAEGLVEIGCGGSIVAVTGAATAGSTATFAVRPEDVILFADGAQLPLSTARNQLPARVVSVQARGATSHIVLDAAGVRLAASVSRASAVDLGLEPGQLVLAVFKATAVRWATSAERSSERTEDVGA
jgi:tungstate transport system ATP-binding protein